ncbi:MAG: phosphoribosyltransferase family protein [Actinomycetota bacterium]|nr:phosphoribosyltransferase family protein [Actinomycetota bacterium]MEC7434757.1 phosphoribosyltransferase family protein [Actinomycetota bacterium]MEC8522255.1 phosphoribosyltransferase family protein [Actinomycetota bacterium]MED5297720.1 phosphoribosyltransferase family protein [Actinomycetota bacterium]MED6336469.1 phosphoribosyltransferase family protein [Actinomycetota bacterium]
MIEQLRSVSTVTPFETNRTIVGEFSGCLRDVVNGMKFKKHRGAANYLGGLLSRRIIGDGLVPGVDVHAVTWVPAPAPRRKRGFDPSELMARMVGAQLGLPVVRTLVRADSGEQKTRCGVERWNGPGFRGRRTPYFRVLLIDDVVTTGATLAAASGALRTAGVSHIHVAAVAATPKRVAEGREATSERYRSAA